MQNKFYMKDAIRYTIQRLQKELEGMSPKVSLYAKIEREIEEEYEKLKELGKEDTTA